MKINDPISTITHFVGAILSIMGIVYLVSKGYNESNPLHLVTYVIFGLSLVLLYCASTIYHAIESPQKLKILLKRIDHMMIFVLIAGTYTPICLITLKGLTGYIMLATIWLVAISGIILKALWINIPRWLSSGLYIIMGWLCIFAIYPLFNNLPFEGFMWLVAGGVIYTIGGIIYGTKWPKVKNNWFGFHEIFHLFVIGGSVCHFILIYSYI